MPLGTMRRLTNLLVAAATVLALANFSARAQPSDTFAQEIEAIVTSDGLRLPAVFTYPSGETYNGGPAILHLPDGPGTSAVRASDTTRFAAEGLAENGFVNLTLEPRYVQSYAFSRFDDAVADVRAAVDMLTARGFTDIVLTGHGLGTLLAARYVFETGDSRIKAIALYSPSRNLAEAWRNEVGEDKYWDTVDTASRAISEGGRGAFIDLGEGLIFTPASFLDWYGPIAKTSLIANLSAIDKPIYLAAGVEDSTVPKGRLEQLEAVTFLTSQVETKYYQGAGHNFAGAHDALVSDTARWLAGIGVRPVARITTKLVDVTTASGTALSGVLYGPVESARSKNKPVILLSHGWTSDIMRSTTHWLGRELARKGYTALAFQTRSSGFRGIVSGQLEEIPADIALWVDFLDRRNYGPVVAVGHSTGSLWLSYYLNQTGDERVKGVVYLAPMRDMPQHARLAMGEDRYARLVLEAQEAMRDGKGTTHLINAPFPQAAYDDDVRQPMYLSVPGAGFTYYYADSFLSYWGPTSKATHKQLVSDLDIPLLALGGSRDPFMQGAYLIEFTEAAGDDATYIFYGGPEGAANAFDGYEKRAADDIAAWLEKTY